VFGVAVCCSGFLGYCVTSSICCLCISLFEQIGNFSDFWRMVGEGGPKTSVDDNKQKKWRFQIFMT
jgi:hypothetical protein